MRFSQSEKDKIELDHAIFSELSVGKLKAKSFYVGKKAGDQNDFLVYNQKNGILFYDADGQGGDKQVQFATLEKQQSLGHDDFLIA